MPNPSILPGLRRWLPLLLACTVRAEWAESPPFAVDTSPPSVAWTSGLPFSLPPGDTLRIVFAAADLGEGELLAQLLVRDSGSAVVRTETPPKQVDGVFEWCVEGPPGWVDLELRVRDAFGNEGLAGRDSLWIAGVASVAETPAPAGFRIEAAWPNPFNPALRLRYRLLQPADVRVALHDALGRRVLEIAAGRQSAGEHVLTLDAAGRPSGWYAIRLEANGEARTMPVLLLK